MCGTTSFVDASSLTNLVQQAEAGGRNEKNLHKRKRGSLFSGRTHAGSLFLTNFVGLDIFNPQESVPHRYFGFHAESLTIALAKIRIWGENRGMGKKKFRLVFDSPFITIFVAISTAVFLLDTFVLSGNAVRTIFSCPAVGGADTFSFKNPLHYFRLLLHPIGNVGAVVLVPNIVALLLLGPQMENRFGTPMLALMSGIASLVCGVLNSCLGPQTIFGAEPLVFMLIFLGLTVSILKRGLNVSQILTLVAYSMFVLFSRNSDGTPLSHSAIHLATSLAGGICAGALGFLVAPKRTEERQTATKRQIQSEPTQLGPETKKSRRRQKIKKARIEDDVPTETEIGTL